MHVPLRLIMAATPDEGEPSVERLSALADLAYWAGELSLADHAIRQIYAHYDRRERGA
jgi:hypothetical protein